MNVLLMGGTGWLGHNIAKVLRAENIDVTILTRGIKQEYVADLDASTPFIVADKNNEDAMKEVFSKQYTHVIDTVPTVKSLELVMKYAKNLHHYVHCSSTGGYAPLPFIPCNETARYGGFDSTTGWDRKRVVDNMLLDAFLNQGFPGTVIRPCYITGEGLLPLDNQGDRREDFIRDIIEEKVLDLPNDAQALLQPVHVKDLARSFFLAITHPNSKGQVYNICLDHAVTLAKYVQLNADVFGRNAKINCMPLEDMLKKYEGRINAVGLRFLACHMCFSIDKARRDLDYVPEHTPEEAIQETALWTAKVQGLTW